MTFDPLHFYDLRVIVPCCEEEDVLEIGAQRLAKRAAGHLPGLIRT